MKRYFASWRYSVTHGVNQDNEAVRIRQRKWKNRHGKTRVLRKPPGRLIDKGRCFVARKRCMSKQSLTLKPLVATRCSPSKLHLPGQKLPRRRCLASNGCTVPPRSYCQNNSVARPFSDTIPEGKKRLMQESQVGRLDPYTLDLHRRFGSTRKVCGKAIPIACVSPILGSLHRCASW